MTVPIARLGDWCSGHGCFPPRPSVAGSSDSFVNGISWHRQGDAWLIHSCGQELHPGVLARGSSVTFVNNIPAGRVGDPVNCGSCAAEGSSDSFAG